MRNVLTEQDEWLNEDMSYTAQIGDLEGFQHYLRQGADINYISFRGKGSSSLEYAAENNKINIVTFILENGLCRDSREIGKILLNARSPEMIKLASRYNPDCNVFNEHNCTAVDLMIINHEFDLLAVYDECGLPRPPIDQRSLHWAERKLDLQGWSALTRIKIPQKTLERFEKEKRTFFYNPRGLKRSFNRITRQVSQNA